ncbi:MAG: flagellar hook-basal body complex protein FliE [Acidobacteriota bacterium]|nr:flagellar hook-basal body complex protein FliE [Acidobacteriota bacterium]
MNAIFGLTAPTASALPAAASPAAPLSFSDALAGAVNQVESSQTTAQSAAMGLLAKGTGDVHNVALAAQRAELSMELFQQVRNKFVQAYQEIMKMPM